MDRHGVRRILLRALRRSFPHLGRFIPALSACLAEALFRTPPRHSRLRREESALAFTTPRWFRFRSAPSLSRWSPTSHTL
jgi:hypothetical protein